MAVEPITPRTYPIWFVTDEAGNKPEAGSIFEITYETMRLNNFNVKWVTPRECLQVREKVSKMFVMDPFSGPAFEHLLSLRCRIMGPLCLYGCMRDDVVFPRRSHPVYSIALMDVVVCCTKLRPSERADIRQKVEFMCGTYSEDLTKHVTHLVCDEVGSKKYHVAANFRIPIVLPLWVEEIWNNSQHKLTHGTALVYDDYRCPVFQGLTITVSQLHSEDRELIKQLVEEEGGSYSASLEPDNTTHLVLLEPKGEKFKYANEWGLFCVHEKWFYDSLEKGYCMDENLYPPIKSDETSQTSELETVECSSGLEESMPLDVPSSTTPQSPIKKAIPSLEMLDSFSFSSLPKCDDFLDACNIFLCDFKDSHMKKLCKIINAGGGNRFSKYSNCITHVVCAKKNGKMADLVKESSHRPHVISFDWLLECCKEGRLIDETPFSCMEKVPLTPEGEVTVSREMKNDKKKAVKQKQTNCTESQKPEPAFDMDDIMKQYLPSQQQWLNESSN